MYTGVIQKQLRGNRYSLKSFINTEVRDYETLITTVKFSSKSNNLFLVTAFLI